MISREDIEGLAALARLQLSEAEVVGLQKDVSGILEYVGQVSALQASATGHAPTPVAPAHHNIMRADTPRAVDDQLAGQEAAVRAAFPKMEKDYNVVRKIIQKDE